MKKLLISVAVIAVALIAIWYFAWGSNGNGAAEYSFVELYRGDLESTISSSGTLYPVTTIQVGTQVSGTIAEVFVDFNDTVKKGQLLAVLDTVLLKVSVVDAQASLERVDAQLAQAQADYDRNKSLFDRDMISGADFLPFQVNLKTQQANLKSAQANLLRAERNLDYAVITSPIAGTVIQRNVEAGQTVAASFSTPTLFEIAEDLRKMEIYAEVDESDIGEIKVGQSVRFDVQTYADRVFTGTVRQVRLQPSVISNVVTYTVIVNADNDDNLLLPGMTATVDFITQHAEDVLLVPNTALRYTPTEEQLTAFRERRQRERESSPDSTGAGRRPGMGGPGAGGSSNGTRPKDIGTLWYLGSDGQLSMEPVRLGMTDGSNTQIVRSRNLEAGAKVISGLATAGATASAAKRSTLGGGPPPGGPHF